MRTGTLIDTLLVIKTKQKIKEINKISYLLQNGITIFFKSLRTYKSLEISH